MKMKALNSTILIFVIAINVNAQVAEIPFELKNNLILLKGNINNNLDECTFVFDTGATSDLLDHTTAKKLGLEANYKQEVSGAGGTKTYDIVLSQKLTLNHEIEIDNTHIVLTDLAKLKERLEKDFDGIIGYSLLKTYVTKIDYENQKILLYNQIESADTTNYTAIPFEFGNGIPIPQFDLTITLRNGESFTGKILFDSGAALTLLINTPYNKTNQLSEKAGKSLMDVSENLSGTSTSERIAVKSITFGGYELNDIVVSIAHDEEGVSSYEDYLGILGGEVISKFNVILDYSSLTVYLKPNNAFNDPFEFPVSGIKLKKMEDKILIDRIEKTSPAYKKGIRKGNQVLAINDDSSGDISIYRDLLKKENDTVSLLFVDTKGKTKKVDLTLKRLL